jgi:hypothetical protein
MTTLQSRLETIKQAFGAKIPDDVRATMNAATQALIDADLAVHAIGEGAVAPTFMLPNPSGELVPSKGLVSRGPLVLTFFRGHW